MEQPVSAPPKPARDWPLITALTIAGILAVFNLVTGYPLIGIVMQLAFNIIFYGIIGYLIRFVWRLIFRTFRKN